MSGARTDSTPEILYGLDLLKLVSLFIVTVFHFLVLVFHAHKEWFAVLVTSDLSFEWFTERLVQFWYFGWTYMAVAAFLIGKKSNQTGRFYLKLCFLLLIGWPLFNWAFYKFQKITFEWDVYPALAVCFAICFGISKLKLSSRYKMQIVLIAFLLSWLALSPSERIFESGFLNSVFFGGCANRASGFPLFPLVFFIVLFYFSGQAYRDKEWDWLRQPRYPTAEFIIFLSVAVLIPMSVLGSKFFGWGGQHALLLDSECITVDFMPVPFWGAFSWSALLIRLTLIKEVNTCLRQWVTPVTDLFLLRRFGAAYFVSYMIGAVMNFYFQDLFLNRTFAFYSAALIILPLTELVLRALNRGAPYCVRTFKKKSLARRSDLYRPLK